MTRDAFYKAHKALEQQPCEDAINRKDAILQIQKHQICSYNSEECYPEQCERNVISWLNNLPPVTPTRKKEHTGHWIEECDATSCCSECGMSIFTVQNWFNYCPNCGAKMESEDKE